MFPIVSPYLDFLEYAQVVLLDEVSELSEEQLQWRTDPTSPSIKEIVFYLTELEEMYLNHYSSTLMEVEPPIEFLDEEGTLRGKNYLDLDINSAKQRLEELRGENLSLLRTVRGRDWVRVALLTGAVYPLNNQLDPGMVTLAKLCEWHAKQMKKYLERVRRIKAYMVEMN